MVFLDAVVAGYANFLNFKGRATRTEYWFFTLFSLLCGYGMMIIDRGVLGFGAEGGLGFTPLYILVTLVNLLPGLAVTFRRIHDIGRSAWSLLFVFIPLVGVILLIYWFCRKSDEAENAYGPPSDFGA